jgi:hypothetical protein
MQRPPVAAYTYVVSRAERPSRNPWQLSVRTADGTNFLSSYPRRSGAVTTARLLAGRAGRVEVRS